MNAFADSLFSLLFGWLRSLVQGIWGAATAGHFSGFFTWLGDHWLWLALIMALIATLIDFAIWMIRWRPYLVWKTRLRRMIRFFKYGKADYQAQQHFQQGYQEGVALDMPPDDYAPDAPYQPAYAALYDYGYGWDQPAPEPQQPPYQEEPAVHEAPVFRPAPAWQQNDQSPAVYSQPPQPDPLPPYRQEEVPEPQYFAKPQGYEPPPLNTSTRVHGSQASDMPAARRKRRSDKYDKQKASWHHRLMADDEDDGLLNGLPPAVDKEQAFHQPVYPQHPDSLYAAWQRPGAQNQGTDRQA